MTYDADKIVRFIPLSDNQAKITIEYNYKEYLQKMFHSLRHLLWNNSILMFILLLIIQTKTDLPMISLITSRFKMVFGIQTLHALYQYYLQNHLVLSGFLEHDDYQVFFKTFKITPLYAMMLPFLSYTSTFLLVLILTIAFKYIVGGISYVAFDHLPAVMTYYRRY